MEMKSQGRMAKYSLKNYKEARDMLPHIDAIIQVLSASEKALNHYNWFIPVADILQKIKQRKPGLESIRDDYRIVLKNKGKCLHE